MLLERHFDPNATNIKNLTIETPQKEPELPFDPERDITQEDWERMKDRLTRIRGANVLFAGEALKMALLFPERKDELHLDETVYKDIKKFLESKDSWQASYREIFPVAEALRALFPDHIEPLKLQDSFWSEMKEMAINTNRRYLLAKLKFIFPDFSLEDLPPFRIERIRDNIEESLNFYLKSGGGLDLAAYTEIAVYKKILFPHDRQAIDNQLWKKMKERLDEYRRLSDVIDFINHAFYLKILAADKVNITEAGVEIIMPGKKISFDQPVPSLPEARNF